MKIQKKNLGGGQGGGGGGGGGGGVDVIKFLGKFTKRNFFLGGGGGRVSGVGSGWM